jgi:hypothetical protein
MGEKTRFNNDQEDELNQSRFLVERGAEVVGTQAPGEDGTDFEEEDIAETKSRFREQPANVDPPSEEADKSPFYGQGFEKGDDTGIRRGPESADEDERESLGA